MSVKSTNEIFAAIKIEAVLLEFCLSEAEVYYFTIQYLIAVKQRGCYFVEIRFLRRPEINIFYRSDK